MIKFFCDYCGKEISAEIIASRHLSDVRIREQKHYCDRDCQVADRKRKGEYATISAKGREKRSTAVAKSNQIKPRRKRKDAPIMA